MGGKGSGRKHQPTAVLKLHGSPAAKTRPDEPKPPTVSTLKRPAGLTQAAGRKWSQMIKLLGQVPGLLTIVDAESLQQYCELWSVQRDALAQCKAHGWETETARGTGPSPAAGRYFRATDALVKLQDRFGLNPASRSTIRTDPTATPQVDKKAAYFA